MLCKAELLCECISTVARFHGVDLKPLQTLLSKNACVRTGCFSLPTGYGKR